MKQLMFLFLVLNLIGCSSEPKGESEPDQARVLQDFVDAPKERARGAADKLEAAQGKLAEQASGLADQ